MLDQLVAELAAEEGFRPYVYDDGDGEPIVPGKVMKGHPTIWYGLCVEKGRMPKLPERLPREVLEYVVRRKAEAVLDKLPWLIELPEATQRGVFAMAYQLGVEGVMKFKNMIDALSVGNLTAAAAYALDSVWARQTPARARRVAALIANEVRE